MYLSSTEVTIIWRTTFTTLVDAIVARITCNPAGAKVIPSPLPINWQRIFLTSVQIIEPILLRMMFMTLVKAVIKRIMCNPVGA